ncbi:hypothetical protein Ancab_023073 [Ancistrocladus abbreviatus]
MLCLSPIMLAESNVEEVGLNFPNVFISETVELESSLSKSQDSSFNNVIEAVANHLFNMMKETKDSGALGSDSDKKSPRECLWKEFEEDVLDSGSFFLDPDSWEEEPEFSFAAPSSSCLENPTNVSSAI